MQIVNEMKVSENSMNKDFVNLHETNRKRRSNEMTSFPFAYSKEEESNNSSDSYMIKESSTNTNQLNVKRTLYKINQSRINNNNILKSNSDLLNDEQLDIMLKEVGELQSREEIREYLKAKITNIISNIIY